MGIISYFLPILFKSLIKKKKKEKTTVVLLCFPVSLTGLHFPNKKMMYLSFINDISHIINKNDIHLVEGIFSKRFPEITVITRNKTDVQVTLLDVSFTQRQHCTPKHRIRRAFVLVMLHLIDMKSLINIFPNPLANWLIKNMKGSCHRYIEEIPYPAYLTFKLELTSHKQQNKNKQGIWSIYIALIFCKLFYCLKLPRT